MRMKLFSRRQLCLLCHETTYANNGLCKNCQRILPSPSEICTLNFNKAIVLFDYQFPLNTFITQLKFQGDLCYAKLLGVLLTQAILRFYAHNSLPHVIIPVPLHSTRLKERGFNQSLEIAKTISRKLNIPIDVNSLYRKTHTPAQSTLSKTERANNIRGAFSARTAIKQKHVVLLDDVITTGQTLDALAQVLIPFGVEQLDAWCCAKTPVI